MFERHYKPDSDFVLVRLLDVVDDAQLRQHVLDYNQEAPDRAGLLELADCRELVDVQNLTVQGCLESARLEQGAQRVTGGMLAILVSNQLHYGMARAYAAIAEMHRNGAGVFYTLEEAVAWLGVKESLEEIERFIAECAEA